MLATFTDHLVITEHNLLLFLIQFALLLGLCRLAGYLFGKLKQSSVTAELLVGILPGELFRSDDPGFLRQTVRTEIGICSRCQLQRKSASGGDQT